MGWEGGRQNLYCLPGVPILSTVTFAPHKYTHNYILQRHEKQYNAMTWKAIQWSLQMEKVKKVPLLLSKGTRANRFETGLPNIMHLTHVCAHTQSQLEPQHLCSSTFHVLCHHSSVHISTSILFSITAARCLTHPATSRAKHMKTYLAVVKKITWLPA